MASLNEIKVRIQSVQSTQKITSAMMMIASAKLNRAQAAITNFLPYQEKLDEILINILSSDKTLDSPFIAKREVKRTAIVACSSNSSLCGAFNSNLIKSFIALYNEKSALGKDNVFIYPVGKKMKEAIKKAGIKISGEDYTAIAEKPVSEDSDKLAELLINQYLNKEIDEVIVVYSHFISNGSQKIMNYQYLPFQLKETKDEDANSSEVDYIFEPSKQEILDSLIPTVLHSKLFAAFLGSNASEHASRMIAMQTATDNADNLKDDLTIMYNKQRQQAVTNELLDIIGGANAIS